MLEQVAGGRKHEIAVLVFAGEVEEDLVHILHVLVVVRYREGLVLAPLAPDLLRREVHVADVHCNGVFRACGIITLGAFKRLDRSLPVVHTGNVVLDQTLGVAVEAAVLALEKRASLVLGGQVGLEAEQRGEPRIVTQITLVGSDFSVHGIYVRLQLPRPAITLHTLRTFVRANSVVDDHNMVSQGLRLGCGVLTMGAFVRFQTLMNVVDVVAQPIFSV